MRLRVSLVLFTLLAMVFLLPASAPADDWNRLSTAVFDHPVQIPGQVLPAGIYVFKLAETSGDQNIVQIWNADQTVLHATVMGFPESMGQAPKENRFVLEQGEKGGPAMLKAWFHEGDSWGLRFIYKKDSSK